MTKNMELTGRAKEIALEMEAAAFALENNLEALQEQYDVAAEKLVYQHEASSIERWATLAKEMQIDIPADLGGWHLVTEFKDLGHVFLRMLTLPDASITEDDEGTKIAVRPRKVKKSTVH
jgi:hypothetical protein